MGGGPPIPGGPKPGGGIPIPGIGGGGNGIPIGSCEKFGGGMFIPPGGGLSFGPMGGLWPGGMPWFCIPIGNGGGIPACCKRDKGTNRLMQFP